MTAAAPKLTARDVVRALYWHFSDRWAVLTEVTARPATVDGKVPAGTRDRRIDVLLVRAGSVAGGIERVAIEVKVTRADFLSDVRCPAKQAPWRALAHRHAYAVPAGLVGTHEVPGDSGLLVFTPDPHRRSVKWERRAPKPTGHNPGPLPQPNMMDAFWRAARAEARAKGYDKLRDDDMTVEDLRAELARVKHQLGLAEDRFHREVDARQRWQKAYGAVGHPPCSTCGKPLKPARGYNAGSAWQHLADLDEECCKMLRTAAAERELHEAQERDRAGLATTDYQWRRAHVPGPEPVDVPEPVSVP